VLREDGAQGPGSPRGRAREREPVARRGSARGLEEEGPSEFCDVGDPGGRFPSRTSSVQRSVSVLSSPPSATNSAQPSHIQKRAAAP